MQQNCLDTVLTLSFNRVTEDMTNLAAAKRALGQDHYGLKAIKEKILNCLAMRKLDPTVSQGVLCLAGPPGTSKTSIAESIARTLGWRYVRISLGDIQDEAELRDHHRTYVGMMPGRIVEALRRAGSKNPLIPLDEIDKLSEDHRSQAAVAALLETLDSSQSQSYHDYYVELPMDLSQVFFLATANTTKGTPAPFMDRMNLIYLNSYTEAEKFHIVRHYLLSRAHRGADLTAEQFSLADGAVGTPIRCYARETGVRDVKRKPCALTEKCVRQLLLKKRERFAITTGNLEDYLNKARFPAKRSHRRDEVGVAHGLTYTAASGVAFSVEVEVSVDRGLFRLTGQMGAVMRESAELALVVARQLTVERSMPSGYFRGHDFHLHVPAGAVPEDGPSAGAVAAPALLSVFRHKTVRADLTVTGEITLRGHILPVDGLKEKLLATRWERFAALALLYGDRAETTALSKEVTARLKLYYTKEFRELAALALTRRRKETDGRGNDNSMSLSGRCLWEKAAERGEGEGGEERN